MPTKTQSETDIETLMYFLNTPLDKTDRIFEKFASLKNAVHRGQGLEQFVYVEGTRQDKIVLVAHADTVWDANGYRTREKNSTTRIACGDRIEYERYGVQCTKYDILYNENGGLGADDRAGCAILWLLKDLGHSLLVVNGEEFGGIGSRWLMDQNQDIANKINNHNFMLQLDRTNGQDFKCYHVGTADFRGYIQQATNYTEPDRYSYTDICTLCRNICGVNLSVGYYEQHSEDEFLVIPEWLSTLNLCRAWLAKRQPKFPLSFSNCLPHPLTPYP